VDWGRRVVVESFFVIVGRKQGCGCWGYGGRCAWMVVRVVL
jgi:hypothetical protein